MFCKTYLMYFYSESTVRGDESCFEEKGRAFI